MKKNITTLLALAVAGFFVAFPLLFPNPAVTSIAVFVLIFAGAAMGYNLLSGYTGYLSLGHAAFYGIGAYLLAFLCQIWTIPGGILPFLLLPVVGLLTGICSLLPGWIALKTTRFTFLVMTMALFVLAAQLPTFLTGIISGIGELTLPLPPWNGQVYNLPFYYVALLLLFVVSGTSWWIRHSRYGLTLLAIRDDEGRAEGLGVRVGPLKLLAFMLSASFVGMAGAMIAYFIGFLAPPSAFDRSLNIAFPLMVFLGGSGTVWGPMLGAILVVTLQQYLTLQFGTQNWDLLLDGALLLAIILALPEGIVPTLARHWRVSTGVSHESRGEAIWSKDNRGEIIPAPASSTPITPAWEMASPAFQEGIADAGTQRPSPGLFPTPIPHRPVGPAITKGQLPKVRTPRLVSLSVVPEENPASHPSSATLFPRVGWSCPRCNGPLLAWGESHVCQRCGLTLPG